MTDINVIRFLPHKPSMVAVPRPLRDLEITWIAIGLIFGACLAFVLVQEELRSLSQSQAATIGGSAFGGALSAIALQKLVFSVAHPAKSYRVGTSFPWEVYLDNKQYMQVIFNNLQSDATFIYWAENFLPKKADPQAYIGKLLQKGPCKGVSLVLRKYADEFAKIDKSQIYQKIAAEYMDEVIKVQIFGHIRAQLGQSDSNQWQDSAQLNEEIVRKRENQEPLEGRILTYQHAMKALEKSKCLGQNQSEKNLDVNFAQLSEKNIQDAVISVHKQGDPAKSHALFIQAREGNYWFSDTVNDNCGVYRFETREALFANLKKHLHSYRHSGMGALDLNNYYISFLSR